MRRSIGLLSLAALAVASAACHKQPQGSARVVVIGSEPKLRDPAEGPLAAPDAVLLQSVAQGLVAFDANGNIVGGLAERWNVSDDGLSYIFRLASTKWPDGRKVTAQQAAKLLKREIGPRSKNVFKDTLGAVEDVVAMTDRVIEIQLSAPRPNLLSILAQPELAIVRDGLGTGPFAIAKRQKVPGAIRLVRDVLSPEEEVTRKEEILLSGSDVRQAVEAFASGNSDLVLGGTFANLPDAQQVKLPRDALRFDPVSGLFGLVPTHAGGDLANADVRRLLSASINRDGIVAALDVPGLAPRTTLLEPGLDGIAAPAAPAWAAVPLDTRRASLASQAAQLFGSKPRTPIRLYLPQGRGADILFRQLQNDWNVIGFTVERVQDAGEADLRLVDAVAPSTSPSWFVREFHCGAVPVCDSESDRLMDAARNSPVIEQRYALLAQAAANIDTDQLFMPIAAPVRWSLVGARIQGFAGNRFAVHTLTNLMNKPAAGD